MSTDRKFHSCPNHLEYQRIFKRPFVQLKLWNAMHTVLITENSKFSCKFIVIIIGWISGTSKIYIYKLSLYFVSIFCIHFFNWFFCKFLPFFKIYFFIMFIIFFKQWYVWCTVVYSFLFTDIQRNIEQSYWVQLFREAVYHW